MELEKLLKVVVDKNGSDLFITTGVPPSVKINGRIVPITKNALTPEQAREFVYGSMTEKQARGIRREPRVQLRAQCPGESGVSVSAPFSSATSAAWCCAGSRRRSRNWRIWTCRMLSVSWP